MKTSLVRAALAVCLLGSASILIGAIPSAALAAEKPAAPAAPVVSKPVGVILDAAVKLMSAGDYATAKATVLQAEAVPNKTPNDDYEINVFLGKIALQQNDHPSAEIAFTANAESPVIPDGDKAATFRVVMLLALESKHFDKVFKYANSFRALGGPPDDQVLSTLATAYYYTNDFANAETFGKQSIAATPAGKIPTQNTYNIVYNSQINLKNEGAALTTLEKMVTYYSDPGDWGRLIDYSLGTKGIKDLDALFLYRLGFATKASSLGADYGIIAGLALSNGYPVEAQADLEAGLAAGKLSNSGKMAAELAMVRTRAAKDRESIASFDAMATKSPNGELDVKLAEAYYGYARYADAAAAARRGLGKGGGKTDANEAYMVLGMSLAMQGKKDEALAAFNNVKSSSAAMMKAQHLWSLYAGRNVAPATP